MRIIAVTNNKGGVGKTTTAVSLAAALHQLHGQRVLAVDLDPQANLTDNLIGRGAELDMHIGNGILDMSLENVILETASGLHLAPAAFSLAKYETLIPEQKLWRYRLAKTLATVADQYDYAVLDCPPTLQTFTLMALVAATGYLIPTEPEKFAFDGLQTVTDVAEGVVQSLNPTLRFLGVSFTRYHANQRNTMHKAVIAAVTKVYGAEAVLPSIRRDAAVAKSQNRTQTLYQYAPGTNAALDYAALTNAVLARLD